MIDPNIELVARNIARVHFNRKQWTGHGAKRDRVDWLVDRYWRTWVDHAKAAVEAVGEIVRARKG